MNKIRVITLFSGYDSQCLSLERLKQKYPQFDYELVAWCEIDDTAIRAHNCLFPQWKDRNIGDITKVDLSSLPDCELLTYSFPCQDISQAGLQKGFEKNSDTRSALLWECEKIIKKVRPKYLLMENVKALVTKKFIGEYHKWLSVLDNYGYTTFSEVLNAKDFGIPQNRERIFGVSILRDSEDDMPTYHFPKPIPLQLCLADILEEDVDEKFFLSNEMLARFCEKSIEEESCSKNKTNDTSDVDVDFENFFVSQ